MEWLTQLEALAATAIAMVLGGAVGFERELKDRPAGFRTHMLVAGAAALLVGVGRLTLEDPAVVDAMPSFLRIDPLRLVEAVIAGVAFIGAGTIFGRRGHVNGITTASSLLMVAVVGIAAGFHYYVLAVAATALTLAVLALLGLFDRQPRQHRAGKKSPTPRDD
ncbi:MAG: MgtC/SapB family protein [Lysobacter sp.]